MHWILLETVQTFIVNSWHENWSTKLFPGSVNWCHVFLNSTFVLLLLSLLVLNYVLYSRVQLLETVTKDADLHKYLNGHTATKVKGTIFKYEPHLKIHKLCALFYHRYTYYLSYLWSNLKQCGFRKGNGCLDPVFAARQICQPYLANWKDVFWAFMNLENTYVTIDRYAVRQVIRVYIDLEVNC